MVRNCGSSYAANLILWHNVGKFGRCSRNCACDTVAETSKAFKFQPQTAI